MSDRYQAFSQSNLGKKLVNLLGLPKPVLLERFSPEQSLTYTPILMGATEGALMTGAAIHTLNGFNAQIIAGNDAVASIAQAHNITTQSVISTNTNRFKAVLFDASGIKNAHDLIALHHFFSPIARQIETSGKIVVIGLTPESIEDAKYATAQRGLEGFTRSIAKEFKKGIAVQLVYAPENQNIDWRSTLGFFLSPKSAYVSAQVVRLNGTSTDAPSNINWQQPFANKVVVVTGASRGIGESIAKTFARDGAKVVCLDVPGQVEALSKVAQEINGTALPLDVTADDAAEQIMTHTKELGGLDIIVHNAGITRDKTLANMPADMWQLVMNINLSCQERINDALLAHGAIQPNGRIVCVSSISGIAGNLGQSNYGASKAAVIGMVQATAKQLAKTHQSITINAVAPGFIETQMTAAIPFTIREAGRRMNSMSQGGLPVDVAETIAWLAHPASQNVNGQIVRVCGQSFLGA